MLAAQDVEEKPTMSSLSPSISSNVAPPTATISKLLAKLATSPCPLALPHPPAQEMRTVPKPTKTAAPPQWFLSWLLLPFSCPTFSKEILCKTHV